MLADSSQPSSFHHVTVLQRELVEGLLPDRGGWFLDATLGGGGHSELLLSEWPNTQVIGLDRDPAAIAASQTRLQLYSDRVQFQHVNFANYQPGDRRFQGIMADLGVSSPQLDEAERGFSFRQDAPLDMRMDPTAELTAAAIVNEWDETDLANLIYQYGEERLSRRIARRIVEQRPFERTLELSEAIAGAVPRSYRYGRIHPATRTFQALRIAVNGELDALQTFLDRAPDWLAPGGRIALISFHSLEDRIIKHALRGDDRLTVITRKPLLPSEAEIESNPRSRSAKLRIAERVLPES
ncbi:16S rRNA (cytosine(1402)-N(4))-methyltransferase RsmH [Synechococcus elongatus]|uniref:Ribosomal RNA small subunit methyltransferase H n=2 Tax=Synechococcus elongatus TaxID=32046 RepID=RSMH_SYNE7|nr:16S rRNA (cytosine(1402)-N(4))-methyltransferase RsmH [Synechococcus elongatus]Q31PL4.1 RecName: Full=Ribosomal RNA small subunit methyltransferase H; AltName: Full=16S rRNA m(4)C1402 methyltransferase; AltName: Full=rRNA (cytosine-N(4)-)-methyltransferase RsmH [Synechococcus elongatus PCC 7942 = FACHB-805]Q5N4L0.1 RecName: Full=Ribosomal RNA small subunit methyltransferase H; AltName: Full=16S rRNA m(4)C1402 methyltransferase; AltName: Full=rRNA (cytosine-N(4)-)-methyltransferase RsmH [Synech